jgi:hypothetical protein
VDVVFAGHDHVYERVKPQNGIYYFTEGSSGELRAGDLKQSTITAKGYDSDNAFMLVEFAGSEMNFQTISRMGQSVDSGVIQRQVRSSTNSSPPAWSVLWTLLPGDSHGASVPNNLKSTSVRAAVRPRVSCLVSR